MVNVIGSSVFAVAFSITTMPFQGKSKAVAGPENYILPTCEAKLGKKNEQIWSGGQER